MIATILIALATAGLPSSVVSNYHEDTINNYYNYYDHSVKNCGAHEACQQRRSDCKEDFRRGCEPICSEADRPEQQSRQSNKLDLNLEDVKYFVGESLKFLNSIDAEKSYKINLVRTLEFAFDLFEKKFSPTTNWEPSTNSNPTEWTPQEVEDYFRHQGLPHEGLYFKEKKFDGRAMIAIIAKMTVEQITLMTGFSNDNTKKVLGLIKDDLMKRKVHQ